MAFAGFDKNSGPSNPPKDPTPFGTFPSFPSSFSAIPNPNPNPNPSSDNKITFPVTQPPIQQQLTTPSSKRRGMPLDWEYQPKQSASISYISSPTTDKVDANVPLKSDNPNIAKRTRSSPLRPSREGDVLGFYTSQNANARRPAMLQSWHSQAMQPTNLSYVTRPRRLSPVAVSVTPHDVDANISIKRNRPPPLTSQEDDGLYNPSDADSGRPVMSHNWRNQLKQPTIFPYIASPEKMSPVTTSGIAYDALVNIATQTDQLNTAQSTWSPPLQPYEDDLLGLYNPPNANARRLATSPTLSSHLKESVSLPSTSNQRLSPVATNGSTLDALANFRNKSVNLHVAKRTRSPPLLSHDDDILDTYNHNSGSTRRNDASPSTMRAPRSPVIAADPCHQMNRVTTAETLSPTFPANLRAPKRSQSPPLQPADVPSTSFSIQLDSEREMQAKAKRLARFNVELSQTLQIPHDLARHKISGNKHDQAVSDNHRNANGADGEALDTTDSVVLSDNEAMESSKVVVGKCTDMCPESEREERERKGDLDKFERLNGERNQTTKFLAVKKYNRTAEREANLIRPLPVLRETVDYLLNLLDRPYDENFLGIYNFLWDRMRAVRMDLRMQHIFNQEAILMLEQMIRLHIVAMHELCEYKKGEGFVEGFDAHLNIEQMNKTSVELFQMYEDHRKRGKSVPTEKEFRGYYALLKLDKHPGYKVEPSELSLDLAKMTSEMRCTPEILFARAVARSCRIGNFIAFFRLARKATYLQACLMHAHFAKLRTQALASLHSGLQNNQGIPVSHVVKWLGMEGEDVESLVEYHGFSLRRYEEPYVVKEGSFLNNDADYPTTRSRLVHHKKSRSIMDDVKSGPVILRVTAERKTESTVKKADIRTIPSTRINEEMPEFNVDPVSRAVTQPQLFKAPLPTLWNREYDHELTEASLSIWNTEKDREMTEASPEVSARPPEDGSVSDWEQHVVTVKDTLARGSAWPNQEGNLVQVTVPASSNLEFIVANPLPQMDVEDNLEYEASIPVHHKKDDETFREKLILILRKWKQRSSELRQMREQREFLASAALSSLTLGMPVRRQSGVSCATEDLNIDRVVRERYGKLGKSWARLNISELTQSILTTRNPDAKCISWKLLFLVQDNGTENQTYNSAMKWLHSKIMGSDMQADDDLLVSLPNLSIWKSWTDPAASETQVSCLAIIRKTRLGEDDAIDGSSCLLFLASGNVSWDVQRIQLHKLFVSIPSGANLPLLILITGSYEEPVDVINKLGVDEADKTRISSSSVIFLYGNSFFDDDLLKDGLRWLASSSPLQPVLQSVDTRELVLSCLRRSLSVLENKKCSDINPNHCILAFNEALDRSSEEIVAAASMNPNRWPSPETNLLEKSSNIYLPSVGWSSPGRIGPLISAIKGCKLPPFPGDMSMLNEGSSTIEELRNKKLAIEECLINYLTESTRLFDFDLAGKEADVMLQKGAGLELRGSSRVIVPRWPVIFRRIYNWQLMRLRGDRVSEAYILARKDETDAVSTSEFSFSQNEVWLDELMEISCDVQFTEEPVPQFKTQHAPSEPVDNEEEDNGFMCDVSVAGDGGRDEERVLSPPVSGKKDNELDMLLERCNQLQDMIQTKLSIYF